MNTDRRNRYLSFLLAFLGFVSALAVLALAVPSWFGIAKEDRVRRTYEIEPRTEFKLTPVDAADTWRKIGIILRTNEVNDVEIRPQGLKRMTVVAPKSDEAVRLLSLIGKRADLFMYDWERNVVGDPEKPITGHRNAVKKADNKPGTVVIRADYPNNPEREKTDQWFVLKDRPEISIYDVLISYATIDSTSGANVVLIFLTERGQRIFKRVTRRIAERAAKLVRPGQPYSEVAHHFAVVVNREVVSRPMIDFEEFPEGISSSRGLQIEGIFSAESATEFASLLSLSTMPVNLKPIDLRIISAQLSNKTRFIALALAVAVLIFTFVALIVSLRRLRQEDSR